MLNFDEQLEQLEQLKYEADYKSQHADEVMKMQGYKEYQEWVERYTRGAMQPPRDFNSLVAFTSLALFNAGVQFSASYFTAIKGDAVQIRKDIEALEIMRGEAEQGDIG